MKIKLTLKIPLKTTYKGIKLQQLERFLQKKKKRDFIGGLAFEFLEVLKTLFGISKLFKL